MVHCKMMNKCPHYAYTYTENQANKVEQPFERAHIALEEDGVLGGKQFVREIFVTKL